jgi:RND superfamily putative drug exporter
MLRLLGDRINWPRRRAMTEPARERRQDPYSGFWGGITHVVMARPIVSVTLAAGLLLAAAIPAFDIHTGVESLTSLPPGQARDGYQVLVENYPAGITSPVQFVIGGPSAAAKPVVDNLRAAILETGHFASELSGLTWSENGETAVFSAILLVEPDSDTAFNAIRNLRATIIPEVLSDSGEDNVEVWVTGAVPANVDFTDVISDYTPWVFAFVLTSSFVLLTLAFRSLIVPLKAIILNLLSVGATWGIMVLVFQKGFLADFLGFQQAPVIQIWVPILLFAVLFGLSMDYHVFLLSRIREQFDHSGNNRESVAIGLHSTARIITGAALIMVVVFGGFATGSLVALQQLGFGLAVAVFLDATIVRTVLVPSTMALLGDRNWYLPGWLHWLPDLRVEGQLDAPESFPARGDGE